MKRERRFFPPLEIPAPAGFALGREWEAGAGWLSLPFFPSSRPDDSYLSLPDSRGKPRFRPRSRRTGRATKAGALQRVVVINPERQPAGQGGVSPCLLGSFPIDWGKNMMRGS